MLLASLPAVPPGLGAMLNVELCSSAQQHDPLQGAVGIGKVVDMLSGISQESMHVQEAVGSWSSANHNDDRTSLRPS